jgi:hypothetical protein
MQNCDYSMWCRQDEKYYIHAKIVDDEKFNKVCLHKKQLHQKSCQFSVSVNVTIRTIQCAKITQLNFKMSCQIYRVEILEKN